MGENAGDGNGGTMVYAVSYEYRDPNISINVCEDSVNPTVPRACNRQKMATPSSTSPTQ